MDHVVDLVHSIILTYLSLFVGYHLANVLGLIHVMNRSGNFPYLTRRGSTMNQYHKSNFNDTNVMCISVTGEYQFSWIYWSPKLPKFGFVKSLGMSSQCWLLLFVLNAE